MTGTRRIVLASGNRGKLKEIARLTRELGIEVVPQSDFDIPEAEETGATFAENSLIKARHAARLTGLPAIADDSGLCVDALDGRPGVYSARYAGPGASDSDNILKLLAELDGVEDRGAAFHCVATYVAGEAADPLTGEGCWQGSILESPAGTNGFGYDPVFLDPASGLAAAELSPDQKNRRSHRGQALRMLVERIRRETARG